MTIYPFLKITEQYLGYLRLLEELDINLAAEFFLAEGFNLGFDQVENVGPPLSLYSRTKEAGDPRQELVQRLIEHEKFKNATQMLYQKN